MSLPLPILASLTSGRRRARVDLECELRGGRYFLFASEGRERWAVLPLGASPEAETEGVTREEALAAAAAAGFSRREAVRAIRKVDLR